MSRDVFPYAVPDPAVLVTRPWQKIDDEGAAVDLPTYVDFWDYQTDLVLRQSIEVDIERLCLEAALDQPVALRVLAEWTSSASQTSGILGAADVQLGQSVTVGGTLRGTDLGGRLTLKTSVIVGRDAAEPRPFTACRVGEILVTQSYDVHLQGDSTLFPISVCDFAAAGFDPYARWVLQTPVDPFEPSTGRFRLFLNVDDSELIEAAKRAAKPTPVQRRLLDHLNADVTRQLLDLALLQPGWAESLPKCADDLDSFGASLGLLLGIMFPTESVDALVSRRLNQPGLFAAAVQGARRRREEAVK